MGWTRKRTRPSRSTTGGGTFISILRVGRRGRSQGDQRRHASWRRSLDHHRLDHHRVQERRRHRPPARTRRCNVCVKQPEGQMELSTVMETDINLPSSPSDRPQASPDEVDAGEVRAARRGVAPADGRSDEAALATPVSTRRDRRVVRWAARRAFEGAGDRQGALRSRTHRGVNLTRMVAVGGGCRRRAAGDVKDLLLLDVTPLARDRDARWGDDDADSSQHHDPTEERDFSTAADSQTSRVHVLQERRWRATTGRSAAFISSAAAALHEAAGQ